MDMNFVSITTVSSANVACIIKLNTNGSWGQEDAPTKLKVTVNVSDDDWQRMQELHNQWMVQEKQNFADQHKQQEVQWRKQSHRLTDIVRNNEGVWLSQRLFYIVGSLSLLSIITIVLEIAFYVYFHWIL